jgi:hypothetical protein
MSATPPPGQPGLLILQQESPMDWILVDELTLDPLFRMTSQWSGGHLALLDAKTHAPLWDLTAPVIEYEKDSPSDVTASVDAIPLGKQEGGASQAQRLYRVVPSGFRWETSWRGMHLRWKKPPFSAHLRCTWLDAPTSPSPLVATYEPVVDENFPSEDIPLPGDPLGWIRSVPSTNPTTCPARDAGFVASLLILLLLSREDPRE